MATATATNTAKAKAIDLDLDLQAISLPNCRYDNYFIHDNGGFNFRVAINEQRNHATVYKYNFDQSYENYYSDSNENEEPTKPHTDPIILDTPCKRIFLGESLPDPFIADDYELEIGNSILLHITGTRYIFIGMYIYEFISPEPILEYQSPIGNNDVPYPFAKTASETFLMVEDAVLDNKLLEEEGHKYPIYAHDPYKLYYKHGMQTFCVKQYLKKKRSINGQIIHNRF